MTLLLINMEPHDVAQDDIDIQVLGESQESCLATAIRLNPDFAWYRWRDADTGENGRNQDVFPWESEDWDEGPDGNRFYESSGLPVEDNFGPAPLYKNLS